MAPKDTSPSHSEPRDGTPSLFTNAYTLSTERLNDITKLLRHCGIEKVVPPLPKIVVIGNQSTGKSSLIEAISKIKVPRLKGTTTRCPMEVSLRSKGTDGWTCSVGLAFNCSSDLPAGKEYGLIDFDKTQIPAEVSLLIRRAQLAILNPAEDPKKFLDFDETECNKYQSKLAFSEDMVVVEITDADVDVNFIDLPGIIANTLKVFPPSVKATNNRQRKTTVST